MIHRIFRRGNREYRVTIEFDDESLMEDHFSIDIVAEFREFENGAWGNWNTTRLTAVVDPANRRVIIFQGDRELVAYSLDNDSVPEPVDFEGSDLDIEAEDQALAIDVDSGAWEQLIQSIPSVDPFLGCLIKGAVSTLVGQIIRCWRSAREFSERTRALVRNIAGCLKEYRLRMLLTFMYRSGRCMITAGVY